ncbi:MAG: AMP-binding protein, partial [Paracoccaceae bacterium]|nr:AMP-binding protein [Paracoccaceae bacterium]
MTKHDPIQPQVVVNGVSLNAAPGQRPLVIDGCTTLPGLFQSRCSTLGSRTAHREKDLGIWKAYSWSDYWNHARLIGLGLKRLGLERGRVVSILSEDRKEWLYADMGIQCVGGISSGVYTTDSSSQLAYILKDSGARAFISDEH